MRRLILVFCLALFFGCAYSSLELERLEFLKKKIHGRYKLVSSVVDQPVDLNNDGVKSKDLTEENLRDLSASLAVIFPLDPVSVDGKFEFCFSEFWPVEVRESFMGDDGRIIYRPNPSEEGKYRMWSTLHMGVFSDDLKELTIKDNGIEDDNSTLVSFDRITVVKDGELIVRSRRRVFTEGKWIELMVETLYRRWSKTT